MEGVGVCMYILSLLGAEICVKNGGGTPSPFCLPFYFLPFFSRPQIAILAPVFQPLPS